MAAAMMSRVDWLEKENELKARMIEENLKS